MNLREFRNEHQDINLNNLCKEMQKQFCAMYPVVFNDEIKLALYIKDNYSEEKLVEFMVAYVTKDDKQVVMDSIYEFIKDNLGYCMCCNNTALDDDLIQLHSGKVVCNECLRENYYSTISGHYILKELCVQAYNIYNEFVGMGEKSKLYYAVDTDRYYESADFLYEIDGEYYYNDYRKGDPTIYSYHYHKSEFKYIGVDANNTEEQIGLELEIVAEEDGSREDLAYLIADHTNLFVFERDSSIGNEGVECITHITSLKYLEDKRDEMMEIFSKLKRMGARSHDTNTCGLHIHVNRAALGSDTEERNETLKKLLYIVEVFRTEIEVFSRRRSNNYARFRTNCYDNPATKKDIIADTLHPEHHYYNVNTQPTNTIEFRMFRGTLRYDTILLSIMLCKNLIAVAKQYSESEIAYLTFDTILQWNTAYAIRMSKYYNSRFSGGE